MTTEHSFQTLQELALYLREFAAKRNWDKYHSPKNLAGSVIIEAAELLEHFQWKTQQESNNLSADEKKEVAHEMADVLIYLTRMADLLDINLLDAAAQKVQLNSIKYPPPQNQVKNG